MNALVSLRWLSGLVAVGLFATNVLASCAAEFAPGDFAAALAPLQSTPDVAATQAIATIEAALRAPESFRDAYTPTSTPTPTLTPTPTATPSDTPTPAPTATPTRRATPRPTPNVAATEIALRRQVDLAVAATLTAQPTATPQATSTPSQAPDARPVASVMQMVAYVNSDEMVNLRSGPGTEFSVLMGVNPGEEVLVLGRNQDATWMRIRTTSGTPGWMSAEYVSTAQLIESYPVVDDAPLWAEPGGAP